MTQDELWLTKWQDAIDFLQTNHRNPSKFIPEERNMVNFLKHTRKQMNQGLLKEGRIEEFRKLQELMEQYKRKNQCQ